MQNDGDPFGACLIIPMRSWLIPTNFWNLIWTSHAHNTLNMYNASIDCDVTL